ncbi:hypothetical protein EF918_26540, partial [Streptomyces sp. WAC06614]
MGPGGSGGGGTGGRGSGDVPRGVVAGLTAGFAGVCAAQLAAAAVRPESAPVTAVGAVVVDATPHAVKDWAVREFGTADKLVLTVGILVLLAGIAAAAGVLAVRRPRAGAAVAAGFGLVGVAAAVTRPPRPPAVSFT